MAAWPANGSYRSLIWASATADLPNVNLDHEEAADVGSGRITSAGWSRPPTRRSGSQIRSGQNHPGHLQARVSVRTEALSTHRCGWRPLLTGGRIGPAQSPS